MTWQQHSHLRLLFRFALVDVVRFARVAALAAAGWAGACFFGVRPSEIGLNGAISLGVRLTSDRGIDDLVAPCTFVYRAPSPRTWRNRLLTKPLPTLPQRPLGR